MYRGLKVNLIEKNVEKCLYFDALGNHISQHTCFKYLLQKTPKLTDYFEKNTDSKIENRFWIKVKDIYSISLNADLDEKCNNLIKTTLDNLDNEEYYKVDKNGNKTFKKNQNSVNYQNLLKVVDNHKLNIIENIKTLFAILKQNSLISYNMISFKGLQINEKIARMLEIFTRLNNGGTKLKPADLLYSQIATYSNDSFDVRQLFDSIVEEFNTYNNLQIKFELDRFLRLLWLIFGENNVSFQAFYAAKSIRNHSTKKDFNEVKNALLKAREVYLSYGFSFEGKPSYNLFLPIAYYFYHTKDINFQEDELKIIYSEIAKYYEISISSGFFGEHGDTSLIKIKDAFRKDNKTLGLFNNNIFNCSTLKEAINKNLTTKEKPFAITDKRIDEILNFEYGKNDNEITKILYLLTENKTSISKDLDHMHPKKFADIDKFKKEVVNFNQSDYDLFVETHNSLANIQLLSIYENRYKSQKNGKSLNVWLSEKCTDLDELKTYAVNNFVVEPTNSEINKITFDYFKLENYKEFYNTRKETLRKILKDTLGN